jgi:hypothetical protein
MPHADMLSSRIFRNGVRLAVVVAMSAAHVYYHTKGQDLSSGKLAIRVAGDTLSWAAIQMLGGQIAGAEFWFWW